MLPAQPATQPALMYLTTEPPNKKLKTVNDENLGRALKNKIVPAIPTRPRSVLGEIGNQKVENVLKPKAPSDQGKVQKVTKLKVTKVTTTAKPRPKSALKHSNADVLLGDNDVDDMESAQEMSSNEQDGMEVQGSDAEDAIERIEAAEEESYSAKLIRLGVPDIDKEDADDPLACTEYVQDVLVYLKKLERLYQPSAEYMSHQVDITWKMRSTLVNWLVEVHWKYKLYPETLFLAINIMDRYLQIKQVQRDKLQLVGVTSMLIAAKFEEIYSPSIEDFLYVCNDSYTNDELLKMERGILYALEFRLGSPCPLTFLRRISKAEQYDIPSRTVAKYLIEVSILDECFLKYHPSLIAAASTWLSRKMLKKGDWDQTLEFYSGFSEKSLESCVNEMLSYLQKNSKFRSIYKKYSSSKFLRASLFVEQKINAWMNNEEGPAPPADLSGN